MLAAAKACFTVQDGRCMAALTVEAALQLDFSRKLAPLGASNLIAPQTESECQPYLAICCLVRASRPPASHSRLMADMGNKSCF